MHIKKYRAVKLGIVAVLAATIGSFVSQGNYIIPLIAFAVATIIILLLSPKVNEIKHDERVEKIGGKAARFTLTIVVVGSALASVVLMALAKDNDLYQILGFIFSGLVWISLLSYSIFFHYFNHKGE